MISKKRVCVLLAAYNPKDYIELQVETILNQKGVYVELVIRDDGSSNKSYIQKYINHPRITIIEGQNLGVARNIMELIKYASERKNDYDYFAYSDQDDYWLEDKLFNAVDKISSLDTNKPALYCSNLKVVDETLNFSHYLFKKGVAKCDFGQALSQVFCFACTTVFNFEMVKELQLYDIKDIEFDCLVYFLAVIYNNMYFDDESFILYRQHGSNVSGQHEKGMKLLKIRLQQIVNYKKQVGDFEKYALYIIDNMHNILDLEQYALAVLVADYRKSMIQKFKLIFNKKIRAGYYPKDFYRFLRILVNKY